MQHGKTWSLLLLPTLFLVAPKPSFAQAPRIYVVPPQVVGEESSAAEALGGAMLEAVKENPIIVLSPSFSRGGGVDLKALQKKLTEGQKQIESDPEQAIEILRAVVEGYESSMASVEDLDPYLAAVVALADAYLMAGYEDEFYGAVKKFASMRPEETPKRISEDLGDAIARAQEKVMKAAPGTLTVSASEPAFSLRVDGNEVEDASKPLTLKPGTHFLVFSAPGKVSQVARVEVPSGKSVTASATLVAEDGGEGGPKAIEKASAPPKKLLASLRKGILDDKVRKQAVQLAEKNKAELVVITLVARDSAQYRAYPYALRAKDAALIALPTPTFLPGSVAALSPQADEILEGMVQAAYAFPEDKTIPASPAIVIEAKGPPVPVASVGNNTGGSAGKVDPYSVDIAALPTDIGSDQYLEAPPDARGDGAQGDGYIVVRYPKGGGPVYNPRGGRRGSKALDPYIEKPPRDPITFTEIRGKWWFWPAIGVVAAGALGAGATTVLRPRGLETVVTWP